MAVTTKTPDFRGSLVKSAGGAAVAAALVAAVCAVIPMSPQSRVAALIGVGTAFVVGTGVLIFKAMLIHQRPHGVTAVLAANAVGFFTRMVAMGIGAFAMLRTDLPPLGFVIGFFAVYLFQQVAEVRQYLAMESAAPQGVVR